MNSNILLIVVIIALIVIIYLLINNCNDDSVTGNKNSNFFDVDKAFTPVVQNTKNDISSLIQRNTENKTLENKYNQVATIPDKVVSKGDKATSRAVIDPAFIRYILKLVETDYMQTKNLIEIDKYNFSHWYTRKSCVVGTPLNTTDKFKFNLARFCNDGSLYFTLSYNEKPLFQIIFAKGDVTGQISQRTTAQQDKMVELGLVLTGDPISNAYTSTTNTDTFNNHFLTLDFGMFAITYNLGGSGIGVPDTNIITITYPNVTLPLVCNTTPSEVTTYPCGILKITEEGLVTGLVPNPPQPFSFVEYKHINPTCTCSGEDRSDIFRFTDGSVFQYTKTITGDPTVLDDLCKFSGLTRKTCNTEQAYVTWTKDYRVLTSSMNGSVEIAVELVTYNKFIAPDGEPNTASPDYHNNFKIVYSDGMIIYVLNEEFLDTITIIWPDGRKVVLSSFNGSNFNVVDTTAVSL